MVNFLIKFKKYYLAILFVFVLVLLPTHSANAACIAGFFPITDCVLEGVSYFVFLIFTMVGKGIAVLTGALQWIINLPVYPADGQKIAVIDESWKIMRNFANMFFIVALILMAFATIFDVLPGAAKYNARALFGRFLLTALLINFSLVLGVMVIQGTQVLSNTFLTAIGDMSGRLGQGLNPSLLFPKTGATTTIAQAIDQGLFGMLIQLVFALVLAVTFLFSLLTATIFAFVRIPIIWALLVVSPIAWILNIFPAGEGMFKKWWSTFIGWNMFLPIFLFFLYFGLYFLQGQDAVIKAIAGSSGTGNIFGDTVTGFTFQMLFMYIMAGVFLIGGTIVAMKASMFSGTGVVGIAGFARGVASRRLGLAGANQAFQEKRKEIAAGEGRLGRVFGGPPAGLNTSRRLFGVRGGDYKSQKEFVDRASKEYDLIQNQYDTGKLSVDDIVARASQGSATNPETYAYRKMAAKMGKLDDNNKIFDKTIKDLADNPYALQDFMKTAKEAKFSDVGAGKILDFASRRGSFADTTPSASPGRREAYRHIQSNAKIMSSEKFDKDVFKNGIDLFGGHTTTDGKSFLEDVGKTRPDLIVGYNMANTDIMEKTNKARVEAGKQPIDATNKSEMYDGFIKDAKDVANMPIIVWRNEDFRKALERKLIFGSNKAQRSFRNQIIVNLRTALNGEEKKNLLGSLAGAKDDDQAQSSNETLTEDEIALGTEEEDEEETQPGGGTPPTGGRPGPTPPTGPATPPATGRGTGQYRGPIGFAPSTTTPVTSRDETNINPNNVVDLRQDQNRTVGTRPPQAPTQNPIEYLKANLEFFDRTSELKSAEESLAQGTITRQEYEDTKKRYEDSQNKVSDLDLKGGLPNNIKRLMTRQDFERKLKELQS